MGGNTLCFSFVSRYLDTIFRIARPCLLLQLFQLLGQRFKAAGHRPLQMTKENWRKFENFGEAKSKLN